MKKFLSMVLALVMTMSLVTISAGAKDFTDDSKITYKEAVDVVSAIGIVDGYTDGSFNPTNELTRGAAAKIICNLILGPTTASALSADTAPFKDVPTTNNFAGYIAYCVQQGIISGYADGTFRPAGTLTGYAFMKMLLGALGYDSTIEGYVGPNWSVQVGKQALGIGLDDGNDDFVGTQAVNREEACLYAFNTLQATMVEYDSKVTANVNGVEVTVGNSKAKEVEQGSYDDNMNKAKLQFAEKYFEKLDLTDGSDDFARPANIWRFKGEKVGTYAKTPDATYSKNVELGDVYKDLNMSEKDTEAEVYLNGVEGDAVVVSKANEAKVANDNQNKDKVGEGSTVEVFYDEDDNDVTICVIDTYVGTVSKTVAAKGNKDAYVVIADEGSFVSNYKDEYTTNEEFDDDTVVLFTYSDSAREIKSVVAAESVEGTLTKKTAGKNFTLGDTVYKFAKNLAYDGMTYDSMTVKSDYVMYLDSYSNVIYVAEEEFVPTDYALVMAVGNEADNSFDGNRVKLLTGEGLVKIYDTDKNYSGKIAAGDIVTFKLDDNDGEVSLRKARDADVVESTNDANFSMKDGKAAITYGNNKTVYANSKTVFVIRDKSGDYKVYTGVANAPDVVAGTGDVDFHGFCKTGDLLTIAFIDARTAQVVSSSKSVIFLAGESKSKLTSDNDGDYYTYNAVINGKIQEDVVKVDETTTMAAASKYNENYVFNGYSMDKNDIITSFDAFADPDITLHSGESTVKLSGEYTVGFETVDGMVGTKRYTVAEDAKVFKINTDGDISEVKLSAIKSDDDDYAQFVLEDGQITYLFVQEVTVGVNDTTGGGGGKTENLAYEASIGRNGNLILNLTYTYPAFVPNNATATMDVDVYDGSSYITTVQNVEFTANGRTMRETVNNLGLEGNENIKLKIADVTYSAVAVQYVDENGKRVESMLKSGYTDQLSTSVKAEIAFAIDTTDTSTALKYQLSGTQNDVTTDTALTAGSGVQDDRPVAGGTTAKGTEAVVVTIKGLSTLTETYSVTGFTDAKLSTFGVTGADKDLELTVEAKGATNQVLDGITKNQNVIIEAKLSGAKTDTAVFAYMISVNGKKAVALNGNTAVTIDTLKVTGNETIESADITIEVVPVLKVESATWDVGTVTITFNRDVKASTVTASSVKEETATGIVDTGASITGIEVNGNVVTVTVTGGVVAVGDKLSITADVEDKDHDTNKVAATTLEMEANSKVKITV